MDYRSSVQDPLVGLSDLMEAGSAVFVRDEPAGPPEDRWPPITVFKRVADLLTENDVPFLVEGGWAVAAYGLERMTRDIDLIIPIDPLKIRQLFRALVAAGGTPVSPDVQDEERAADIETWLVPFRLGGWRVDLLKESSFASLASRSVPMKLAGRDVRVIDPMDLVRRKSQRNSDKDRFDIEFLMREYGNR